ncbi:MAG: Ig domain-containing protein, partial [bacterium]
MRSLRSLLWVFGLLLLILSAGACGGGEPTRPIAQDSFDGTISVLLRTVSANQNTPILPLEISIPATGATGDIPVRIRCGFKTSLDLAEHVRLMRSAQGGLDFNLADTIFTVPPEGLDVVFFWDALSDLGSEADFDTIVIRVGALRTDAEDASEAICDFQPVVRVGFGDDVLCPSFPPVLGNTTPPDATIGSPYSFQIPLEGGESPIFWQLIDPDTSEPTTSNVIGFGFNLDTETGAIVGTPVATSPSDLDVTVRVVDDCARDGSNSGNNENTAVHNGAQASNNLPIGRFDQGTYRIHIVGGTPTLCAEDPPVIDNIELPDGTVGQPYSFQFTATGGVPPLTWDPDDSNVPPGLSLDTNGLLSGIPTQGTSTTLDIGVTDSCETPQSDRGDFPLTINCGPAPVFVVTTPLPDAFIDASYNQTFSVDAINGYSSTVITAGTLPTGLTFTDTPRLGGLAGDLTITGTPTNPAEIGPVSITVRATDNCFSTQNTTDQVITFTLQPAPSCTEAPPVLSGPGGSNTLPPATVGVPYTALLEVAAGTPPVGPITIVSGGVPGLTIQGDGRTYSGTPSAAGDFTTILASVTDSCSPNARTDQHSLSLTVNVDCPTLSIVTTDLPNGTEGTAYSFQLQFSGGFGSPTWSQITGALPEGLNLALDGTISGTPSENGLFSMSFQITDDCPSGSQSDMRAFNLTIAPPACPALDITTTTLDPAINGVDYSFQLVASGGSGNLTWSFVNGNLPSGFTVSPTGIISGNADETPGDFTFVVRVVDECVPTPQNVTAQLTLSVFDECPALLLGGKGDPPTVFNGQPYSFDFETVRSGGVAPFSYILGLTSGPLPNGLTLGTDGVLSGTPSDTAGTFPINVRVTDSCGLGAQSTAADFNLTLEDPCATLQIDTPSPLPDATNNQPYSQFIAASGGQPPYQWRVNLTSPDTLPAGLALDLNTGEIAGSPDVSAGSFNVLIDVSDSCVFGVQTVSQLYRLTVVDPTCLPLDIDATPLPQATNLVPYSYQIPLVVGSEGEPPRTWSILPGGLPALPNGLTMDVNGLIS